MNILIISADICFGLVAVALLTFGILYWRAQRIMPYHLAAMGRTWETLSSGEQVMSLSFMKAAASGFLSCAAAIIFLLTFALRSQVIWAAIALGAVSILEVGGVLVRMVILKRSTGANIPLGLQWLLLGLSIAGTIASFIGVSGIG